MKARAFPTAAFLIAVRGLFAQMDPVDITFGEQGWTETNSVFNSQGEQVFTFADGSVLLVRSVFPWIDPQWRTACTRLLPDGAPDPSFGNGGTVELDVLGHSFVTKDAEVTDDGLIYLAGILKDGSTDLGGIVVRLREDGTLDAGFSDDGILFDDLINCDDGFYGLEVNTADEINVTGQVYQNGYRGAVWKFTNTGTLDPGFAAGGELVLDESSAAMHIETTSTGDLVIAGLSGLPYDLFMAKITPAGDPVLSFGTNGQQIIPVDPGNESPTYLHIRADDRILLALQGNGLASTVLRFTTDGAFDATWGTDGIVDGASIGLNSFRIMQARVAGQGVFLCGYTTDMSSSYVVLLSDAGDLRITFGSGGIFPLSWTTASILGIAPTADNKLIITGYKHLGVGVGTTVTGRLFVEPETTAGVGEQALFLDVLQADGLLTLRSHAPIGHVTIRNAAGAVVLRHAMNADRADLDVTGLGTGLYVVEAFTDGGRLTRSFVAAR